MPILKPGIQIEFEYANDISAIVEVIQAFDLDVTDAQYSEQAFSGRKTYGNAWDYAQMLIDARLVKSHKPDCQHTVPNKFDQP